MKVRCVALTDAFGKQTSHSSWLKIGATYHVLSIIIEPTRTLFRLIGEEAVPALFEPKLFELVSSAVPPSWVVTSARPGFLDLEPEAWSARGFWESFYDREPDALSCFEKWRRIIQAEDP
jgi:hypothetical protein